MIARPPVLNPVRRMRPLCSHQNLQVSRKGIGRNLTWSGRLGQWCMHRLSLLSKAMQPTPKLVGCPRVLCRRIETRTTKNVITYSVQLSIPADWSYHMLKSPHPADTDAADPCATKSCMTGISGDITLAKTRSPGSLSPTLRVHIFTY